MKLTTGDADVWAFVQIGEPFPENPVRVKDQNNQFVALWYKHGKPVCGRAWNNGGVVECSFPYNGKELTGERELGGQIQILTYKGKFDDNKFYYEWVPFGQRNQDHLAMVKCGNATCMLMNTKKGEALLGNLDLVTEKSGVAYDGKEEVHSGKQIQENMVICRNHIKPGKPSGENIWKDVRIHDAFPENPVMPDGRKIDTGDGKLVEHNVALWYKNGEPVMGRAWMYKGDKIEASFGILGREFTGAIGSLQILRYTVPAEMGFEHKWIPFGDIDKSHKGEWKLVRVGDVAPCLIKNNKGHEKLGCIKISNAKASVGWAGTEEVYTGGAVEKFLCLCRKDIP